MKETVFALLLSGTFAAAPVLSQDVPAMTNWDAPAYWQTTKPAVLPETEHPLPVEAAVAVSGREALALPSSPLPFVAITPCRQFDSRSGSKLLQKSPMTVTVTGAPCGIPTSAQAASVNITIFNITGAAGNGVFKVDTVSPPTTAWINYPATETQRSNAGAVSLSSAGAIVVQVNQGAGSVDFTLDVNGYYSPQGIVNSVTAGTGLSGGGVGDVTIGIASQGVTSNELALNSVTQPKIAANAVTAGAIASGQVVKSLNGLADSVTLAGGGGASVSQLGQTITVTAPAGVASGSTNQTLRNNGSGWVASSALTNDGNSIGVSGVLYLPATTATTGQILIGSDAFLHSYGPSNTFVGASSGNFTLTGAYNTGLGIRTLLNETSGEKNTAVGLEALYANTGGSGNSAFGMGVLRSNTIGTFNTAVGYFAMPNNTTANNNTAVGVGALYSQSYDAGGYSWDTDNTALGYEALNKNQPIDSTSGNNNTAVGSQAMHENLIGDWNVAVGYQSLFSNTTGFLNCAVGGRSLFGNTTGYSNTAVGTYALVTNVLGRYNTAVGYASLYSNNNSGRNTAIGVNALYSQGSGFDNGGTSWDADNTAVGFEALYSNQPLATSFGVRNTAVGVHSLQGNLGGLENTAVGAESLVANNVGNYNVAIGYRALKDNFTGSGNVAIGHSSAPGFTGNNSLFIGNGLGTLIWGDFVGKLVGINTTAATQTLDVNGGVRIRSLPSFYLSVCTDLNGVLVLCAPSDARLKTNVVELSEEMDVLQALGRLRGVRFDWDPTVEKVRAAAGHREVGVIAQEVEPVLPEIVSTNPDGYKSVDYPKLTAFLIEVAKAQQKEIESLKSRLVVLERSLPEGAR